MSVKMLAVNEYGQQLHETFCMADAFVSIARDDDASIAAKTCPKKDQSHMIQGA